MRSWVSRWWLDRSIRVKGLTVVAIPLLALVAVTGSSLALQRQERGERRVAIAASAVSGATASVVADAVGAETGVRGYAATSDPRFLEPYTAALADVNTHVEALNRAAGPAQRVQAGTVTDLVDEEFARLADIRGAVTAGFSDAELGPLLLIAKVVMDSLRAEAAVLMDRPSHLVVQKRAAISRLETVIEVVELTGLGLGLLAGLLGAALFTSGISRRVRVAADNADRLGQGRRLLAAAPSDDELGRLGAALTRAYEVLAARLGDLSEARDQALLASRTKNDFLSRTSHELRTPLNAILGFAQLLEMSDLDQDDRDSTARILAAGRHLLALINEVIDIARVESNELMLSIEPVALDGLIREVGALMGPLATARGITIEYRHPDRGLAVYADQQRLRQVMINLASNAVKYNHHGGMIRIGYHPGLDSQIELTVTDTGPGLSAEQIERVFLPFERLEAEQHGIEGTGIGLPLALALTEAMRGTLEVASTPGHGSTFMVRLPAAADIAPEIAGDPARATASAPAPPAVHTDAAADSLVVLSIEDNSANTELLSRLFQAWHATTLYAASSAYAGIALAQRIKPDLILLDLHLPDLPGEEAFALLRAEPTTADTPIVVLSADATPGTIRRLHARGAMRYLTKPLDLQELRSVLDETIAERAAANARRAELRP
jgi:signal transduction histidine kinase/AmiR/NasT family two-component response regulator